MNCETNDCRKEKRGYKGCCYGIDYGEGQDVQVETKIEIKSADKMFEELGYNKYEFDTYIDYLSRNSTHCICFRKDTRKIDSHCGIGSEYISIQELQAISKKVEELGWK